MKISLSESPLVLSEDEAMGLASALVEAACSAGGNDPEEHDWRRIPMQFLQFEIERESEDNPWEAEFGFVHCWIRDQTRINAQHVASGWIADSGWSLNNLNNQREVNREDFQEGEELVDFDQALTDGEVFLFVIDEEPTDDSVSE